MALTEKPIPFRFGLAHQGRVFDFLDYKKKFCITPEAPDFVKTTARQGGVFVQFHDVRGADAYEVVVSTDAAGNNILRKERWEGNDNTEGFVGVGNVNQSLTVRVKSLCGDKESTNAALGLCGLAGITSSSNTITGTPETPPTQITPSRGEGDAPGGRPLGGEA